MADFLQVTPQTSVRDTLKLMFKDNRLRVIVVEEGRLAGIVSTHDLVKRVLWKGKPLDTVEIKDVMTRKVSFVTPQDDIRHIANLLYHTGIRCVPVVSEGAVVGIV
ncbi:MAG: CBS domain-containing protein [Candidatus Altiarchaeota archaeon]|nr:CBS domain-containing protein [Candidatus Altiarchaeota archaeon]